MRRDLIGEQQRKYGLLPSVKRQERQAKRLERAPRTGDTEITRITAGGIGTLPNADQVAYTPAVLADWDGAADPGNTDDALDQIAERVTDLEGAPAGGGGAGLAITFALVLGGD